MTGKTTYRHMQTAPLCLLIYAVAVTMLAGGILSGDPTVRWLFPWISLLLIVLAASFHHLAVTDAGDRLWISFGPIPLFRRSIRYEDIVRVEVGRTTILDGWGIHMSPRGGWVWNLWGRDCVVVQFQNSTLRIGTNDAENLARFLMDRVHASHVGIVVAIAD